MGHESETQRLKAVGGKAPDPGDFAAAAECERRAGRLDEAERGLRAGLEVQPGSREGRLVLALVLLDRGLDRAARSELERLAESMLSDFEVGEVSGPVSEAEIDAAMERAARGVATGVDPHGVAIRIAQRFSPTLESGEGGAAVSAGPQRGAFETRTMADVLEGQGDERGAARIRERLAAMLSSDTAVGGLDRGAARSRAELERWLRNLRSRKDS